MKYTKSQRTYLENMSTPKESAPFHSILILIPQHLMRNKVMITNNELMCRKADCLF